MSATRGVPGARWYPSKEQLKDPEALERSVRQILKQQYDLKDRVDATTGSPQPAQPAPSETQGPSTTKLLGLFVEPVDTSTLADGATLKYSKSRGTFFFS